MTSLFVNTLKDNGYRITTPRLNIIREVKKYPLSAKEIHGSLNDKTIDLVTVYRNLELFVTLNLVSETILDGNVVKYELVNNLHHHHLVCEDCGKVKDIQMEDKEFFEKIIKKHNFDINSHNLEFIGRCSRCA